MLPIVTNQQQNEATEEQETRPLWTVEEVAGYLRLKPETVRQMARLATIPAIKMGRVWRFRKQDVVKWINDPK